MTPIFILIGLIAISIILCRLCSFKAYADEGKELTDNISSLLDGLDLDELQKYLEVYGNEYVFSFGENARDIIEYLIKGNLNINYSSYINELLGLIFNNVVKLVPAFAQIIAISILCAVSADGEGGLLSKTTAKSIRLACYTLTILIISSMLVGIVSTAVKSVQNIKRQVEIITPILITLSVLAGGNGSGAIYKPSALFLSSGAIEIISGFIFPATIVVIVLNFLSQLNPQISFTGVTSLIKSVMKWVLGITVTVFGLFITVQGTASSLFDGIFFKVTKYLVGNSVPIVGNFLSAGVDMVVMAGSLVKSSIGILGVVLLVAEIAQPVMILGAFSLALKLCGSIVQPIGEQGMYGLLSGLSKDIEYFIAGLLTVAFMYILVIMLTLNSVNSFI